MWLSECAEHHNGGEPPSFFDQANGVSIRLFDIETSLGLRLCKSNLSIPEKSDEVRMTLCRTPLLSNTLL